MSKKIKPEKRVCIVRQKAYPMQRNMRRNAETLFREGYDVNVICYGQKGQPKKEVLEGVKVHRVFYSYHRNSTLWYIYDYLMYFLLVSFHLTRLSLKRRFDVIEVCNIPDFLIFSTIIPKLLGSKVIFYMFEKSESLFVDGFNLRRKHILTRLYNRMTKLCAQYADHVCVTDVIVQKDLVYRFNIRPEKITLILNVVDESVFDLSPEVPPQAESNEFRVVIVSSILKRYGIQTMVKALPLLTKAIPHIKVHIIGGGEYLPELQKTAEKLGITEYLQFYGFLKYEDVSVHIAQADICIAPMIDDVGTPNKILEYLGMGKATISTNLPGLVSLIDSDCLLYFKPGDEVGLAERVIELYQSPEKRKALGRLAYEFYDRFRWSKMKTHYLEVYQNFVEKTVPIS